MFNRKIYNYKNYTEEDWVESKVIKGIENHCLKDVINGIDGYRVQERDSYLRECTDVGALIFNGLYPVYCKQGLNIDVITRNALEEMIEGDDPRELFQAYVYASEELSLREGYDNLPFILVDKKMICKLKKKILESENVLKKATIDGYPIWSMIGEIFTCDEYLDPDAFFTEEFNNGGRRGYVHLKHDDEDKIKELVSKSIHEGNLMDVMLGWKDEYRVCDKDWQEKCTDTFVNIERGLYPLYQEGYSEIPQMVSETIDSMIDSNEPMALVQAYEYARAESYFVQNYSNLPFIFLNKKLIEKMKNKRVELKQELEQIVFYESITAWANMEAIEKKFYAFSNTNEFFSQNL